MMLWTLLSAAPLAPKPAPTPQVTLRIDPEWGQYVGSLKALAGGLMAGGATLLVAVLAVSAGMAVAARVASMSPRQRWSNGVWVSLLAAALIGSASAIAGWGISLVGGFGGVSFTP